jgi:D-alanyl-D-alanine carboxypeptidase
MDAISGIQGIQDRISEIESRIAAITSLINSRSSAVGWGPGLSGAGQPGPYGATAYGATASSLSATTLSALSDTTGSSDYTGSVGTGTSTPFAQLLDQFQGNQSSASAAPSATAPASATGASAGTIPAFTPPAALVPYGNGHIPAQLLAPIGVGSQKLWAPAASSFQRMAAAASSQGVKIGVTDSYRTYDQQVQLAQNKGLYSEGGLAAQPGQSKHGWGMAVDVDVDSRGETWLRANGAKYGFYETTPREPWHWEYRAS